VLIAQFEKAFLADGLHSAITELGVSEDNCHKTAAQKREVV
jgi:hypothetical protein